MHLPSTAWLEIRDRIGLGALAAFAFFAWLGTGVAHAALAVMVLLALSDGRAALKGAWRDPMTRVFVLFLVYLIAGAAAAAHRWPETAEAQWRSLWPWISLWLFLPVAWCLRGDWLRIRLIMLLAPLGLIAGILRRSEWTELPQWLAGERYEFGYTSLGLSLLSLVIVLGLLSFAPRLLSFPVSLTGKLAAAVLWLTTLLWFLFVLLVAQSRGAWLSLAFAVPLTAALALLKRRSEQAAGATRRNVSMPAMLLAAALAAGVATQFGGVIAERVHSEADVIPGLVSGQETDIPYSPMGARVHLSLWGLRLIARHPWFGYGPGANAPHHLLPLEFGTQQSGFLAVIGHFVHLHNAYLEILMRFGIIGGALWAAGLALFLSGMIDSGKRGIIPSDFFIFGLVVSCTILLFGFFEFRLLHTDFRFLTMLFGGIFYTHRLYRPAHED